MVKLGFISIQGECRGSNVEGPVVFFCLFVFLTCEKGQLNAVSGVPNAWMMVSNFPLRMTEESLFRRTRCQIQKDFMQILVLPLPWPWKSSLISPRLSVLFWQTGAIKLIELRYWLVNKALKASVALSWHIVGTKQMEVSAVGIPGVWQHPTQSPNTALIWATPPFCVLCASS